MVCLVLVHGVAVAEFFADMENGFLAHTGQWRNIGVERLLLRNITNEMNNARACNACEFIEMDFIAEKLEGRKSWNRFADLVTEIGTAEFDILFFAKT